MSITAWNSYEEYLAKWEACRGRITYFMPLAGRTMSYQPRLSHEEFAARMERFRKAEAYFAAEYASPDELEDALWNDFENRRELLMLKEKEQ